jgi:hypothetical protein
MDIVPEFIKLVKWLYVNPAKGIVPKKEAYIVTGVSVVTVLGVFKLSLSTQRSLGEYIEIFLLALFFGFFVLGIGSVIVRGKHYLDDMEKWK